MTLAEVRATEQVPQGRTAAPLTPAGPAAQGVIARWQSRRNIVIAGLALAAIATHLALRFAWRTAALNFDVPLWVALVLGGIPLVCELAAKALRGKFGSDLLAGISIVTAAVLGEYLAGTLVVLMLSGGEALEGYAVRSASSVLRALANRMPSIAHRKDAAQVVDVPLDEVAVDDILVIFPHDICPVDGTVVDGHGMMDESFLTGEPFRMSKTPGSEVISGAVNGDAGLTIRATRPAADSRYARITRVMRESEMSRPEMRRLGDTLGAWYTPLAVGIALVAWLASGSATRFLAVLVIATPCPLLIGIPVAIIGAISLCARRGIIVKDPAVLEQIDTCRTAIFDKTGTLTYGQPRLAEQVGASNVEQREVLSMVASVERYSKHPLALAILDAARECNLIPGEVSQISEPPGQGLMGTVNDHVVQISSRNKMLAAGVVRAEELPPVAGGLECVVAIDGRYAATYRFHDKPRADGKSFIEHLKPRHRFDRVMIVSGDRKSEVEYLAGQIGIGEIHAQQSPEEKVAIVVAETRRARTVFVGDGINDAPALRAATVGIGIGQNSDITTEAAGVVIMDSSLKKVDEFMHISRRMRNIALQSAVGGMALSIAGMFFASAGWLTPVAGAMAQEIIDVAAVLNALRAAFPPRSLSDF